MCVCASRINLPAQNTTATILNALPLACAEWSIGSMQGGFVMALDGVPVKESIDDVGYWRQTRVPWLVPPPESAQKGGCGNIRKVVQLLF